MLILRFLLWSELILLCVDGNKLKNERKYTPQIEKMTENRHHGGQKGIYLWGIYNSEKLTCLKWLKGIHWGGNFERGGFITQITCTLYIIPGISLLSTLQMFAELVTNLLLTKVNNRSWCSLSWGRTRTYPQKYLDLSSWRNIERMTHDASQ